MGVVMAVYRNNALSAPAHIRKIPFTVSVRLSATVRVSCIFLIWAGADGAVFLQTLVMVT